MTFNRDFACICTEHFAFDSDDIADVKALEILILVLADAVARDVGLNVALEILNVTERSLSHNTLRHHSTRNGDRFTLKRVEVILDLGAVMGDVKLCDLERVLARLLKLLLSRYSLGSIPASLDRVTAGDAQRLSNRTCKVLFLLGADDGSIPLVTPGGGLLTDRDIVTRCLAAGRSPAMTRVGEVMTTQIIAAQPEMDLAMAAGLMGKEQIRRLPVLEKGKLCGIVSLGDLAVRDETAYDAGDALAEISNNLSSRD